ncbi:hypothetical protein MBRA1_000056 [Malassezia brasiliensis]|uniref:Major facilitator superfamily (MFS) profile domain-containing protein n=1 Tax=Malassezia brasiliensis TaxID=1821822 RepID=A0AAF0IN73_9BASI|nr:hypothetical protein MBRA1_000056 [Malassezia brasiliensis]
MRRSASESHESVGGSLTSSGHLPPHGAGAFSLVDPVEVQDPLLQEAIEHEDQTHAPASPGDEDLSWLASLPWWRRPHTGWLYPICLLFSLSGGILLAPRMEMYLSLLCDEMGLPPGVSASGRPHIPSQMCRQSPEAQRRLSSLQLVLLLTNGVGCAFSAGFWSRLSDRKGRNRIMMVNILGIFIMDVIVIIVSRVSLHDLPMGANFLAIGSSIEGALGGYSAVTAMSQCYISDVTPSGTRARLFAFMSGVTFAGVAIGPTIGGFLTVATQDVTLALWISAGLHLAIILLFPFVPESLTSTRRAKAEAAWNEAKRNAPPMNVGQRISAAALAPLHSLRILLPERMPAGYVPISTYPDAPAEASDAPVHLSVPHTHSSGSWDINMLLVGIAYFLESATIAIVPIKIQYVQLVFNWGSEMLGFFVSFTALTRMLMLVVVLPVLIRYIHRPLRTIALPQDAQIETHVDEPTPLDAEGRRANSPSPSATSAEAGAWSAADHRLEKQWVRLAVGSALLTGLACTVTGLARTTWLFLFAVLLTSLGGGVGSAVNSLALALIRDPNEAGRLFGAFAVLSTVSSSIVGPYLFTSIFRASAASAPSLVFFVITAMQVMAATAVLAVRLRSPKSLVGLPPRPG